MNHHPTIARRLAMVITLIFALMTVAFVARGLQQVLQSNSITQGKDLRTNWQEWRLVLHRQSPYSGVTMVSSPYPPFTFLISGFLYWPAWSLARLYFSGLNLLCLAAMAMWGYAVGLHYGMARAFAWTLAMSLPAFSSVATGLGLGQNSILYVTALVGTLVAYEQDMPVICGILLGIAMSKINIALPFALPFLFRFDWKIVVWSGIYMLVGTLLVSAWIHTGPPEMIRQWVTAAQRNNGAPYGPASLLVCVGLSPTTAIRISALVFMPMAVVVLAMLRKLPMLTLFGLAAGFGRLWTYHRVYDNIMLVFLVVALATACFRSSSKLAIAALLLVGYTVWYPIRSIDVPVNHLVHVIIWMFAMTVLAMTEIKLQAKTITTPAPAM